MELSQLKVFSSAAQTLNFTKTADQLFITQPAVSYQIKSLEEEFGVRLFARDSNRIKLTPAGEELQSYVAELLELTFAIESRMHGISIGMEQRLKIAAIRSTTDELMGCVSVFSQNYPAVQVDVSIMEAREMTNSIAQLEYDIYFATERMFIGSNTIDTLPIRTSSIQVFAHRKYAEEIDPNDWSTIRALPFVMINHSDVILYNTILEICKNRGFLPNVVSYGNRPESMLVLVSTGIGIAMLPIEILMVHNSPDIMTFPLEGQDARLNYVFGWKKSNYSKAIHHFRETFEHMYR